MLVSWVVVVSFLVSGARFLFLFIVVTRVFLFLSSVSGFVVTLVVVSGLPGLLFLD